MQPPQAILAATLALCLTVTVGARFTGGTPSVRAQSIGGAPSSAGASSIAGTLSTAGAWSTGNTLNPTGNRTAAATRITAPTAVSGRLLDASADRPIGSAFVSLQTAGGTRVAGALTDTTGRFSLTAREPGRYLLRAEALGYDAASVTVTIGDTAIHVILELTPRALVLPAVDARADDSRGCERRPDGPRVVALWDAVRSALDVASWTGETGSVRFTMVNHVRELDAELEAVRREERTPAYATAAIPYGALSPEQLARSGYLLEEGDISWLMGLDADVLLSEAFLESHCFRIVGGADTTRIGLGFTPLRRDGLTDVSGVLWVDRRTSELDYLEFKYENLPEHMRRFGASGEVRFRRLDTGAWIVTSWWIRSPLVGMRRGSRRFRLLGYREDGGSVTSAESIDTRLRDVRGTAAISGTVWDSVTNAPMQNALVFLSGTPFSAQTGEDGSYRMDAIPAGRYAIGFTHPRLDELRVARPLDSLTVAADTVIMRSFAAPSTVGLLRAACPGESEGAGTGLAHGAVHARTTNQPLEGVEVRASWRGPLPTADASGRSADVQQWRTFVTGSDGRYVLCWLPTDREVELRVGTTLVRQRSVRVRLTAGGGVVRLDF